MMKEGKLENGLLGSTALIVQKSHQINTEGHLQPFFSWAFQNGLSYENSEITKAPIRYYAHPFFSSPLKAIECASLQSYLSSQVVCTHLKEVHPAKCIFFHFPNLIELYLYFNLWINVLWQSSQFALSLKEFSHQWRRTIAAALSGSLHPSLLSHCLFKEAQGVHEL